jgi:hypothetical protein
MVPYNGISLLRIIVFVGELVRQLTFMDTHHRNVDMFSLTNLYLSALKMGYTSIYKMI